MANLQDMDTLRFVSLLWGPPKVGKTVLASQFPNPHFVDLDKGITSVLSMTRRQGLKVNFPVYQIDEGPSEDPQVIELAGKTIASKGGWVAADKLIRELLRILPLDATLIVDNLTRLGEFLVNYLKKLGGLSQLRIQDWGQFVSMVSNLMEAIYSASYKPNVLLVAHEQIIKDELTGKVEKHLLFPTSQKYRIPTVVGDLWYLTYIWKGKEVSRVLKTSVERQAALGSRIGVPNIEEPTYEKIRTYIGDALGRELPPPTWTPKGG